MAIDRWVSISCQQWSCIGRPRCAQRLMSPPGHVSAAERLCMPWLDYGGACADPGGASALNGCLEGAGAMAEEEGPLWRPLVLLIPLRLGLTDINEAYIETLKVKNHTAPSDAVSVQPGQRGVNSGFSSGRRVPSLGKSALKMQI